VKRLAWIAVVIYPVGMWFFALMLLRNASTDILSGKTTPFSRSVSFLYKGYKVSTFWWELMEMLRKFLLIGLFVTVAPGTILQIAMGTVVSAAYVVRLPISSKILSCMQHASERSPLDRSYLASADDTAQGPAS
jgi:hypothetical protein